jgi:dephospho-CoA kinase
MKLVGLTGGIGSGKSTVSLLLAERGAVIIDADAITRLLQQPGAPLLQKLADRFGAHVIDANGALDRAAVASIVFSDPEALKDLNSIVHPAVAAEMDRQLQEQRGTDNVVILDIPLLTENPRTGLCGVVVVDVPVEIAVERLVKFRQMDAADAHARISKQASREDRRAIADKVIDNSGDKADLEQQIEELWNWLIALPPASKDAGARPPKA